MFFIYRTITLVVYPLLVLLIFFRIFFDKEDHKRFKEKIFLNKFNVKRVTGKNLIWFHSASIGELKVFYLLLESLAEIKIMNF